MLSPLDLKNKMMEPKKRKYYDKDETDDYLELVMEQYKQLYDENLELQKNVKSLNDGVQYYRSIENTMQKALSELENIGLVESRRTSGRFVTETVEDIGKEKEEIAREQVKIFLTKMEKLGFDRKEMISMIENMEKEEE